MYNELVLVAFSFFWIISLGYIPRSVIALQVHFKVSIYFRPKSVIKQKN